LYYLQEGKNDEIRIEIPKGAYFPKITTKKKEQSSDAKVAQFVEPNNLAVNAKVAVFPFKNLTGDAECNCFACGISEEISVELTKYEDLSVFNFTYLENNDNPESGYKENVKNRGVRFVLCGSVNKIGKQVKILAHLTDMTEDRQIWAESFIKELTLENLFEIQETLSKEIAIKIGSEYGAILQKLAFDSRMSEFQSFDTYNAVLKFYYFQVHQTDESAIQAFTAINQALSLDPESGIAMALLAAMHGNFYTLDLPDAEKSYQLMGTLVEKASKLSPNSLIVKTAQAFKSFVYNEKERFLYLADKCLSISQNSSLRTGALAMYLSLYGEWDRGKELLDKLMHQNIGYPLYLHGATMLYYYRKNEYKMALEEVNKYIVPTLFWAPMLQVAVLGQLNLITEAQKYIDQLLKLKPDFEQKAVYLISIYVKEDELVNHIIEGLRKAGMDL
jgi:TolB-like protein